MIDMIMLDMILGLILTGVFVILFGVWIGDGSDDRK